MAKKKMLQQPLTDERFLKERARLLPIYKCYHVSTDLECGVNIIIVIRKHKSELFSLALYLVDTFCCGVRESAFRPRLSLDKINAVVESIKESADAMQFREIDYVEAHNLIYGAIAWAEEAGILPDKSFELTKYMLEKDDENVELIEYEFGYNGKHHLIFGSLKERDKYLPAIIRNLGDDFTYRSVNHPYPHL